MRHIPRIVTFYRNALEVLQAAIVGFPFREDAGAQIVARRAGSSAGAALHYAAAGLYAASAAEAANRGGGFTTDRRKDARIEGYAVGTDITPDADSLVLPDGTIWSHAASLGTRQKGSSFTIDGDTVRNFVRVFDEGYPSKVPVDYEHGSTDADAPVGQPIELAGDVIEMKAVLSDADLTPEIRKMVDHYGARMKALGSKRPAPSPNGLWIRWLPTADALSRVKAGKLKELSIAFAKDVLDDRGNAQGPAILAVGLVARPFLNDLVSVAASGRTDGTPAASGITENSDMSEMLLRAVSARLGKTVTTETDAIAALNAQAVDEATKVVELSALQSFRTIVGAELGATDPAAAVARVVALKATEAKYSVELGAAQDAARLSYAAAKVKDVEAKLVPATADYFRAQIVAELKAGAKEGETATEKVLIAMASGKAGAANTSTNGTAPNLSRTSGGDAGGNIPAGDAIEMKAREILANDANLKAQHDRGGQDAQEAYKTALVRAEKDIAPKAVGQFPVGHPRYGH